MASSVVSAANRLRPLYLQIARGNALRNALMLNLSLPVYQVALALYCLLIRLGWTGYPCLVLPVYQVRLDWLPLPCIACLSG